MPATSSVPYLFLDFNTLEDFFGAKGPMLAPNASQVRSKIRDLASLASKQGLVVLAVVDLHAPNDPEFAQFQLPPHGLDRSPGRMKIFETYTRGPSVIPPSGQRRPWPNMTELRQRGGQLVLEKTTFDLYSNPAFPEILRNFQPEETIAYGAVFEQDLFYTACAMRNFGQSLTIVEDACAIRDPAAAEQARAGMLSRGVHFEPAEEVLSRVERSLRTAARLMPPPAKGTEAKKK
ncbi:MAG: isochorismatase family protein [Planctomycetota bacterium]|nr:isochorismatase family protein [Planctomycetota bacterium]